MSVLVKCVVIGKDIPIRHIDSQFLRVISYEPSPIVTKKGFFSYFRRKPFAHLHIESSALPTGKDYIYEVVNKWDFAHLQIAFDELDLSSQEILVAHIDKVYDGYVGTRHGVGDLQHKIHKLYGYPKLFVYTCKKGCFQHLYSKHTDVQSAALKEIIKTREPIALTETDLYLRKVSSDTERG
jgi:hypothetical protein